MTKICADQSRMQVRPSLRFILLGSMPAVEGPHLKVSSVRLIGFCGGLLCSILVAKMVRTHPHAHRFLWSKIHARGFCRNPTGPPWGSLWLSFGLQQWCESRAQKQHPDAHRFLVQKFSKRLASGPHDTLE